MSLRVSLLILPLFLTACGFKPMYGQQAREETPTLYAGVLVESIGGRDGQILRMALEDKLNPDGVVPRSPAYRLEVSMVKSTGAIDVARDGTISRYNLYVDSHYTLYRNSDGLAVSAGDFRRVTSYSNLATAYFSTYTSESDALKRAVTDLSEDYRQRLGSYLTGKNAGEPLAVQPKPHDPNSPEEPQMPKLPSIPTPTLYQY